MALFHPLKRATNTSEKGYLLLCFFSLVLWALSTLSTSGIERLPLILRFCAGVVCFGICPGFLILFASNRSAERDFGVDLLTIVSLSFSCNLLLNFVLYSTGCSFKALGVLYLILQVIGFTLGIGLALRRPTGEKVDPSTSGGAWIPALLALGAIAVFIHTLGGGPVTSDEELITIRKILENPSVLLHNISASLGEPPTYLFVPFPILLSGASFVSHIDVALVYSMFFCFTTLLSVVTLSALTYRISGKRVPAMLCFFLCVVAILFDARGLAMHVGIVDPLPNRYGFAAGVLLPLNCFFLCYILGQKKIPWLQFALFIYAATELTFVHARETLLFVGFLSALLFTLLLHPKTHLTSLKRLISLFVLLGVILLGYKTVNLRLAPNLGNFVASMSGESLSLLRQMVRDHGMWKAFFTESPPFLSIGIGGSSESVKVFIPQFRTNFVEVWASGSDPIRLILPLALLFLPLYALLCETALGLGVTTALASFTLVTLSGPLKLLFTTLVGNPEALEFTPIVYILALVLCCDLAALLGRSFLKNRSRIFLLGLGVMLAFLGRRLGYHKLVVGLSLIFSNTAFSWGIVFTTVTIVVVGRGRGWQIRVPSFTQRKEWAAGFAVLSLLWIPLLAHPNPLPTLMDVGKLREFTGRFEADYDKLRERQKIRSTLPLEVIHFLRAEIPPNQTVLARETQPIVENTTHFIPFFATAVDTDVPGHFIMNWNYLRNYSLGDHPFSLFPYFTSEERLQKLKQMISHLGIQYILVTPDESEKVDQWLRQFQNPRPLLTGVYSHAGYRLYQVVPALP